MKEGIWSTPVLQSAKASVFTSVHIKLLISSFKTTIQKLTVQRWHSWRVMSRNNAVIIYLSASSLLCCSEHFLLPLPASFLCGRSCSAKYCCSVMINSHASYLGDAKFEYWVRHCQIDSHFSYFSPVSLGKCWANALKVSTATCSHILLSSSFIIILYYSWQHHPINQETIKIWSIKLYMELYKTKSFKS